MKLRLKQALLRTPFEPAAKFLAHRVAPLVGTAGRPEFAMLYFENLFMMRALAKLVTSDMNCIDVGAHIGSVLNEFIRLAPEGAHIGIEPTPQKAAWLRRKFPQAEILECALADAPGAVTFSENVGRPAFSQLESPSVAINAEDGDRFLKYDVAVRTLDDIALDRPRTGLVKIDVEGAEHLVLTGGLKLLDRDRPVLVFECGADPEDPAAPNSSRQVYDLISERLDYDIFCVRRYLFNHTPLGFEAFAYTRAYPAIACNFIALPREREKRN